jgi:hypothetical protein
MIFHHSALSAQPFTASVDEPFYYLDNFETVVHWVVDRYSDLLNVDELHQLQTLLNLPRTARALLVRMIMRKGAVFRSSKLKYPEIGSTLRAIKPLIAHGWVEADPDLSIGELFDLLTKDELIFIFDKALPRTGRKADWLLLLQEHYLDSRSFSAWCGSLADKAFSLTQTILWERIRLLFFGNLNQDWSEFVLAELGIYRYENVPFTPESRAFRARCDVDHYLLIHQCREQLTEDAAIDELIATLALLMTENPWIARRRAKVLFLIAQHCERNRDWATALNVYRLSNYPGARARCIRMLERLSNFNAALSLCMQALEAPETEAEQQQVLRTMPRLQRRVGASPQKRPAPTAYTEIDLVLPPPATAFRVETVVQTLLQRDDAPILYVENILINSLFGLLCWDAIFAPIAGAFFHPFQHGPADLLHPEFYAARAPLFDAQLAQLDSGQYRTTIRARYRDKQWIQSPFVHWAALDDTLLDQALHCIPPPHLSKLFRRLLQDIKNNRAGLPDLIQFWPTEKRYQMIEVKGPGDRLQDNQRRWLDFCVAENIPVAVCYVQWQTASA